MNPFQADAAPTGFHIFCEDVSWNFQLNRWYGWVGEPEMKAQIEAVAPRLRTYADWVKTFGDLARQSLAEGYRRRAAYYYRCAEFFMDPQDPARASFRALFQQLVLGEPNEARPEKHQVSYSTLLGSGTLPAYRFGAQAPRGTVVFFGGFDSCIEELFRGFQFLQAQGFEVVAFEGPGQGAVLDEGIPLTPDWHRPTAAILDYFGLTDVTLVGLSLGGCLALRSAAHEPRVARVVAYDVLTDFWDVALGQLSRGRRRLLKALIRGGFRRVADILVRSVAKTSPVVAWGISQGCHVTGTSSPFQFLRALLHYETRTVSARVTQDVLLLGGAEDHFIPRAQFGEQVRLLTHARSLTARLFTRGEHAASHCQAGNYRLAFQTIVTWVDSMTAPGRV